MNTDNLNCSTIQTMIEPFLMDELSEADKNRFISHVRECKGCRDELEVYNVIYTVVSQLDNNTEDENIDYAAELEKKLQHSEGVIIRRKIVKEAIKIIAAVAILVLLFLLLT